LVAVPPISILLFRTVGTATPELLANCRRATKVATAPARLLRSLKKAIHSAADSLNESR
jgi:hypothetical protein